MILSATALAAILSLPSLQFAFQADPAVINQRAEVLQEEPRAETDAEAPAEDPIVTPSQPEPVEQIEALESEDIEEIVPAIEPVDEAPEVSGDGNAEITAETLTNPAPAPATDPTVVTGNARTALLADVSQALSAVTTAKGRFSQIAPDGSESAGDFYLRRPGRVRFEYDAPVPILIVADGATVAVEDTDLETQDRVPLGTTPLGLILDDNLDYERDAEILNVRKANGFIAVAMQDRSGETEGTLELILSADPVELQAWQATDAAGGITTVRLADVETGIRISPRLFRIEELDEDEGRD